MSVAGRVVVGSVLLALAGCTSGDPISRAPLATSSPWGDLHARPIIVALSGAAEPCPVSPARPIDPRLGDAAGEGPLYAIGLAARLRVGEPNKVLLAIEGSYQGPILIRALTLAGSGEFQVSLGDGIRWRSEERIDTSGGRPPGDQRFWNYTGYAKVSAPGCYAYQVDGSDFSNAIVFQVS